MKKQIDLSAISRDEKVLFLSRLQKGSHKLRHSDELPGLTFELMDSGLYLCNQTGQNWTREQIEEKEPEYQILIELVSDLKQAPSGFELIHFSSCLEKFLEPKK